MFNWTISPKWKVNYCALYHIRIGMDVVRFCILLFLLCATYGEKITVKDAAEGVICRSYAEAERNGMLGSCKRLWLHATLFQPNIESIECKTCKRLLNDKSYTALLSEISKSEVGFFRFVLLTS